MPSNSTTCMPLGAICAAQRRSERFPDSRCRLPHTPNTFTRTSRAGSARSSRLLRFDPFGGLHRLELLDAREQRRRITLDEQHFAMLGLEEAFVDHMVDELREAA